ncbi:MAG TPA: radical SAM protein [archaeon]|nr:radical SAM protein [archaeon]
MRTAYLEIVQDCNLNCSFCSQGDRRGIRPLPELKAFIDKSRAEKFEKLMITGGEPLLHPQLEEIITYATGIGLLVGLQTNGTLMTAEKTEDLHKAGLDHVFFSIHSHIPEVVDDLMCGKGVLKHQLSGLENTKKSGIMTFITTVVNKKNFSHLPEFFEFMTGSYPHITHYVLNFVDAVGRSSGNPGIVPRYSEVELPLFRALDLLKRAGKSFRVERVPICYMLEFAEHSTELLRLVTPEINLAYREDEFSAFTPVYFRERYEHAPACETCSFKAICPGLAKAYVSIHGNSEVYPLFVSPQLVIKKADGD